MSQVDNRNSTAGKRARTDGGRREDDWTCPSCGNVNFSFRTTCNMRNCDQSRPADHNSGRVITSPPRSRLALGINRDFCNSFEQKAMIQRPIVSLETPPRYVYAPPVPPYGSYNGAPYEHHHRQLAPPPLPYSAGSSYPPHYGYSRGFGPNSLGSPYGGAHHHHHLPPYSPGSVFSSGGMYGVTPLAERYGLGLPAGHSAVAARPGLYLEESSQKKTSGEGRENDWKCPTCGNVNFSFRTVCNMRKCNTPRPENAGPKADTSKGPKQQKTPEGSWKCEKCDNINYPFRTKCNRQNCGAEKPTDANPNPNPNPNSNALSSSPDQ